MPVVTVLLQNGMFAYLDDRWSNITIKEDPAQYGTKLSER